MTNEGTSSKSRLRAWGVGSALVLLATAMGWLAWTVLDARWSGDDDSGAPSSSATAVDDDASAGRVRVATSRPGPVAVERRAGEIHVVEADGAPANARIYTTSAPKWSKEAARDMGRTGDDGVLTAEEREAAPQGYLWAVGRARIAGPSPFVDGGQTLTLGPGAAIRVRARRPDGSPIEGAICEGHRWNDRGISGADGDVVLTGFPPDTEVYVLADVFGGRYRAAGTHLTVGTHGSVTDADVVVDETVGPFALVRITGDLDASDDVELEVAGGELRPKRTALRSGDEPLLVSLRGRAPVAVTLTARCLGKRVARRVVEDLANGTTIAVELELVTGGAPVRGRVLEADGRPAADVHVDTPDRVLRTSGPVRTDADGWFDVRPKWLGGEIRAMREAEACSGLLTLDDGLEEIVLRLREGGSVEGTVRDAATGRPIEGAAVGLWLGEVRGYPEWDVRTDADGRYRFAGIPAGTFVLPAHIPTDRAADTTKDDDAFRRVRQIPDEALILEGIAHRSDGVTPILHDFSAVAEAGGFARIRVVADPGVVLPEEIELGHAWHATRPPKDVDRYGETLEGVTETRQFLKRGYHVFRALADGLAGVSEVVHVAGDGDVADVEVHMASVRAVRVRLVDSDGVPVELRGVEVTLTVRARGGPVELGDVDTDANGVADVSEFAPPAAALDRADVDLVFTVEGDGVLDTRAGNEEVNLVVPGGEWARRMRDGGPAALVVDVPLLDPPPVVVHVVDAAGEPAPGVPIQWSANGGNEDGYEAVSDAHGCVTLHRFADSDWLWLTAQDPWVGEVELHATAEEDLQLRFEVDRRRQVRLRAVLPDGSPAAACTWYYDVSGHSGWGSTDADGAFVAELPASEVNVWPRLRDFWTRERIVVAAGATEAEFHVEPLHAVTVRLELPAGIRRPGYASVYAGERRELRMMAVADEGTVEGTVDLPSRPLSLAVDIAHPRYAGAGHYDGESGAVTVSIVARPLREIVLELVDDKGEPLRETDVHVVGRRDPRLLDVRSTTDVDGRVTVRVPAIDGSLDVNVPGRRTGYVSIDADEALADPIRVEMPPAR